MLIHPANGGKRNLREAARLKKAGVVAGVADLLLLVPSKEHHMLCIEIKTRIGTQTKKQKEWQLIAEKSGKKYVICRSLEEFMSEIQNYLSLNKQNS